MKWRRALYLAYHCPHMAAKETSAPVRLALIKVLVSIGVIASGLFALGGLAIVAEKQIGLSAARPVMFILPMVGFLAVFFWMRRSSPISPWIRLAVIMAFYNTMCCLIACCLWGLGVLDACGGLGEAILPITMVALGIGVMIVAAGYQGLARPAGSMSRGIQAVITFFLVHLFVFGLCLPFFAALWPTGPWQRWPSPLWPIFIIAVLVALGCSVWVGFYPDRKLSPARKGQLSWSLLTLFVASNLIMIFVGAWEYTIYRSFAGELLAQFLLALIAVDLFILFQWRTLHRAQLDLGKPAPWVQQGELVADASAQEVGALVFHGWLGGMSLVLSPCRLQTGRGLLEVPASSVLVSPLPVDSWKMAAGDSLPVLGAGAPVLASGYVEPSGAGPFRELGVPMPSSRGVIVASVDKEELVRSWKQDVVLTVWRPCLLFMVVGTVVMLPILLCMLIKGF